MGRPRADGHVFPRIQVSSIVREVLIRRDGERIVLAHRPTDWPGFFASSLTASADFMAERERMPIQERTGVGDVCGTHPSAKSQC